MLALSLAALLAPAVAAAFTPGEVHWAPGSCSASCGLFDVTLGGDQQGATPVAVIQRSPGQIAWDASLLAYITQFDSDSVVRIDASGAVTTFATGLDGATGLLIESGGRMLAVAYRDAAVFDISAGGDFTTAVPFATGFVGPRNLLQLATGEILLADQLRRAVFDISAGGDFTNATAFASGFPPYGPYDLVQDSAGRIFASTDAGVFDITSGGNFSSATPHATGRSFSGLAVAAEGRLLASDLSSGDVFDIAAAGNYASATPFAWNLAGSGDSALDEVPGAKSAPEVPLLGGIGWGLLASLLATTGAARCRRGALRVTQPI